jgi:hypothetical protein
MPVGKVRAATSLGATNFRIVQMAKVVARALTVKPVTVT